MEAEIMYLDCLSENNLDIVPNEVSKNYVLEDAYVYGEVNQTNINKLINNMSNAIEEIKNNGLENPDKWIKNKTEIDKSMYYCNNLCGVKKECKFYEKYIKELKKQQEEFIKEDIDLLTELENI